jgi:hypothetical protein
MARKRHTKQEETPELLKFREKRKWQIALRRYVLEKSPCYAYAPYFGLDIEHMRQWFESQFKAGISWESFGENWQFDHIIPVTCFDFTVEEDLKLCWSFLNIRVDFIEPGKDKGTRLDMLSARNFFKELWEKTKYPVCQQLLRKIDEIELTETVSSEAQQAFIVEQQEYLKSIDGFSAVEFELLNKGRSIEQVRKESQFIKNFDK